MAARLGGCVRSSILIAGAARRSYRSEDLLPAFMSNRQDIERVAGALFEMTGARHIVLHSGHFRFAV
ncbi:DUF1488 family protein [Cupriavidus sp. a3]